MVCVRAIDGRLVAKAADGKTAYEKRISYGNRVLIRDLRRGGVPEPLVPDRANTSIGSGISIPVDSAAQHGSYGFPRL